MVESPSTRARRGLHLIIAMVVALSAVPLFAAVLPPAAGDRLGAAFGRLAPDWKLGMAAIGDQFVVSSLCDMHMCYDVNLEEPSRDCAGLSLAAWCVEFGDDAPAELRAAVESEFGAHELADYWIVPEADEAGLGIADEAPLSPLVPVMLAFFLLLMPVPLGWGLGVGLRWIRGARVESVRGASLLLLTPVLPAFLLPLDLFQLGFYDVAWSGLFVGAGLLVGGHRWGKVLGLREGVILVVALVLALAILEVGVRLFLRPPPAFPPPSQATLRLPPSGLAGVGVQACKGLFPAEFPEVVQERDFLPGRNRRVLHVGDSMVEGVGVERSERFVSLLNQLDNRAAHVNAGFSGTGPDYYYLATRRWLELKKSDAVVWYIYPFNDIDGGLQERYGCCDGRPLLSFVQEDFEVDCLEWKLGDPGNRFQRSPAPYPWRVATAYSRAAGHLVKLHNDLVLPRERDAVPLQEALRRTRLVLRRNARELADQGVEFTVVLLPYRGVLEGDSQEAERLAPMRDGVLAVCEVEGIRCLDGAGLFGELVESESVEKGFINEPVWDYHFSAAGHRLVAEWLVRVLGLGGA